MPDWASAILSAAVPLVVALLGYLTLLIERQKAKLAEQGAKLDEVHTIVNSQRTDMTNRIDQLGAAMTAAGVIVPPAPTEPNLTPKTG